MLQLKARQILGILLAGVAFGAGATSAHAQTTLRYKFKAGETLRYEMQQTSEMKFNLGGKDTKDKGVKIKWQVDMGWKVLEAAAQDKARIALKIERILLTLDGPELIGKVGYDSREDKEPEGPVGKKLAPILRALAGAEFTMTMNSRGEMSDINVSDKLMEALKNTGKNIPELMKLFSPDNLKRMIGQLVPTLPRGPVASGQTWAQTTDTLMPFGTMHVVNTMTYEGPTDDGGKSLQKITMNPTVTLDANPKSELIVKMTGGVGKGTVLFDDRAGRIVEATLTQNLQMHMTGADAQTMTQDTHLTSALKLKK